jgi:hypothetical protein
MIEIRPITFRNACEYVKKLHRHNKPPRGHKFSISVVDEDGEIVGVAMIGRPVARAFDDKLTAEVNRTCTDGYPNANSMLYGAAARACKAMGYRRVITYTQGDETGGSIKGAGFLKVKTLPSRKSWSESSSGKYKDMRDPIGNGGVERVLWEIVFGNSGSN